MRAGPVGRAQLAELVAVVAVGDDRSRGAQPGGDMAGRPDVGVDPPPVDRASHAVRARRIVLDVDGDHGDRRRGDRRVAVEGGVENDPVGCGRRVGEGVGYRLGGGEADFDVDPGPLGPAAQQDAEQAVVDLVRPRRRRARRAGSRRHPAAHEREDTRRPIRSMPASSVRPCGVPRSTRLAPAASTALTRAATCSGVPLKAKRSSTSSGTQRPASLVLAGVDELAHAAEQPRVGRRRSGRARRRRRGTSPPRRAPARARVRRPRRRR